MSGLTGESDHCTNCKVLLDLKYWTWVRLDGGCNIVCANVSGRPPLDPMPPATRFGPFCRGCQEAKLKEIKYL